MAAAEYRKLILIVWLLVAGCMAAVWGPRAWTAESWETDDFMRLVQVQDLLSGQAWNDVTQYRLDPPVGTKMHWSRLPDAPIALVAFALSPFMPTRTALATAGLLLPPLYFMLFLVAFALGARLMLGPARSPVALLVAISGSTSVAQFVPGHVDHHSLQLVAMMVALTQLLIGLAVRRREAAIGWAAIPFALSVWIGVETLPIIASWFGALGLAWCRHGGSLAKRGAIAGLGAAGIGVAILLTSVPSALWGSPACDAFSVMPVGMMALIGAGFLGMAILGRWARTPAARLGAAVVCGAVAAGGFALAFPACIHGGYVQLDPVVEQQWLRHVSEAVPFSEELARLPFQAVGLLWTPVLALGYCLWRVAWMPGRGRTLWGAVAIVLLAATAMIVWQVRAVTLAQALALLPLSGLAAELWTRIQGKGPRWRRLVALIPILFVCSFILWPAIEAGYRQIALRLPGAPVPIKMQHSKCSGTLDLALLESASPALILSYIDLGPMLLFDTPHSVLAAPYHRDNDGLRATIDLFRSDDDGWIKNTLTERGIDWVVTCPGVEENSAFRTEAGNGLAERLAKGEVPDYLAEVADPAQPAMRFYRVRGAE